MKRPKVHTLYHIGQLVVISSKMAACTSQPVGFNGHPSTHECLTGLRNKFQQKQTCMSTFASGVLVISSFIRSYQLTMKLFFSIMCVSSRFWLSRSHSVTILYWTLPHLMVKLRTNWIPHLHTTWLLKTAMHLILFCFLVVYCFKRHYIAIKLRPLMYSPSWLLFKHLVIHTYITPTFTIKAFSLVTYVQLFWWLWKKWM